MNLENLPKNNNNTLASENSTNDNEERTISLLQKIRTRTIDPNSIRLPERHLIVSYLMADGYGTAEIAQILNVSDRTIERDKKAIREANAIATDPELAEQVVGRLVLEADLSIQRIRKAVRDTDTPPAVKVDAEHRCFQIISEMTKSLQSLGYLPSASTKLQAEITHNIGQIPELPQLDLEAQRLLQLTGEIQDTDPRLLEQIDDIRTQIARVKLADRIQTVSNIIENKGENENE